VIEDGRTLKIESLELEGGEGANRWFKLNGVGIGGRDVHHLCTAAGLQLSRLMRVALGPITMDRSLSRGRTKPLEAEQMAALYAAAGLPVPQTADEPAPVKKKAVKRSNKPGRITRPAQKKKSARRTTTGSRNARR
jgi:23S rRNA pseudouridine2605 synthase